MSDARKSAESAIAMIQSALCEWEEKLATARSALEDKKPMTSALLGEKADLAEHVEKLTEECERWKSEAANLESLLDDKQVKIDDLKDRLKLTDAAPGSIEKKELLHWRASTEKLHAETNRSRERTKSLNRDLKKRDREVAELKKELHQLQQTLNASESDASKARKASERLAEHEKRLKSAESDIAKAKEAARLAEERVAGYERRLESAQSDIERRNVDIERLRGEQRDASEEARKAVDVADQATQSSRKLKEIVVEKEHAIDNLHASVDSGTQQVQTLTVSSRDLKQQLAGLRQELELKERANLTLKISIESLRAYKEVAVQEQQKMVHQVDSLRHKVCDLEAQVEEPPREGSVPAAKGNGLESRLAAQQQLIDSMQRDVDKVRKLERALDERDRHINSLNTQLTARQQLIDSLESDFVELRRSTVDLHKQEADTQKLRTLVEDDKARIKELAAELKRVQENEDALKEKKQLVESLQTEVEELREANKKTSKKTSRRDIREKDKHIAGLEDQVKALEEQLKNVEQHNGEIEELSARASRAEELDGLLEERDRSTGKLMKSVRNLRKLIERLEGENAAWKERYSELEAEYLRHDPTVPALPKLKLPTMKSDDVEQAASDQAEDHSDDQPRENTG